ncbi:hypothetical protein NUM3379_07910 [Kineococcus sp. NUM-3379]
MSTRHSARHRAAARPLTPLTTASESLRRNVGAVGRGTAVVAASSGLVLSVAVSADATVQAAPAAVATTGTLPAAGIVTAPLQAAPATVQTAFATLPAPAPAPVVEQAAPAAVEARTHRAAIQGVLDAGRIARASRSGARVAPAPRGDVAPQVLAPPAPAAVAPPAPAPAPPPAPAPAPAPVDRRAQVLEIAARYIGTPYVYGGTTPRGFDCSGYTGHVFREIGVNLPRVSHDQMLASRRVPAAEALPGDLVFMANGGGRVYHVGIYAGDGMMFDSPRAGKTVTKRKIWTSSAFFGRVL